MVELSAEQSSCSAAGAMALPNVGRVRPGVPLGLRDQRPLAGRGPGGPRPPDGPPPGSRRRVVREREHGGQEPRVASPASPRTPASPDPAAGVSPISARSWRPSRRRSRPSRHGTRSAGWARETRRHRHGQAARVCPSAPTPSSWRRSSAGRRARRSASSGRCARGQARPLCTAMWRSGAGAPARPTPGDEGPTRPGDGPPPPVVDDGAPAIDATPPPQPGRDRAPATDDTTPRPAPGREGEADGRRRPPPDDEVVDLDDPANQHLTDQMVGMLPEHLQHDRRESELFFDGFVAAHPHLESSLLHNAETGRSLVIQGNANRSSYTELEARLSGAAPRRRDRSRPMVGRGPQPPHRPGDRDDPDDRAGGIARRHRRRRARGRGPQRAGRRDDPDPDRARSGGHPLRLRSSAPSGRSRSTYHVPTAGANRTASPRSRTTPTGTGPASVVIRGRSRRVHRAAPDRARRPVGADDRHHRHGRRGDAAQLPRRVRPAGVLRRGSAPTTTPSTPATTPTPASPPTAR